MVTYSTPEEDAQRRDFTVNGLFYEPVTDEVIDFVGGKRPISRPGFSVPLAIPPAASKKTTCG